jgi:hypothetical protein
LHSGNNVERCLPVKKLFLAGIAALFLATETAQADEFVVILQRGNENPFVSFATMSWSCAEVLERHEANRVNGTWLMYDPPDGGQPSRIIWVGCLGAVSKMHCPTIAEKKDLKSGKAYCQDRGYPQPGVKK